MGEMTDEQQWIARKLACHPRFTWRPGMRRLRWAASSRAPASSGLADHLKPQGRHEDAPDDDLWDDGCVPDLLDPATGGVLLEMLGDDLHEMRRLVGGRYVVDVIVERAPTLGAAVVQHEDGQSLGEATARALLEVWGTMGDGGEDG